MRRLIAPLLLLAALAGCAQEPVRLYVPYGVEGRYGFSEETLGPTRVRVRYVAPTEFSYDTGFTKEDAAPRVQMAYELAIRRAAELARTAGFDWLAVERRDNDVDIRRDIEYPPPYPWGWRGRWHSPFASPFYWPPERTVWVDVTVRIGVKFLIRPEKGAIDVKATLAAMAQKYPS